MAPTNRGVSKAQLSQNRSSSSSGPASDLRSNSSVAATPIFSAPSLSNSTTTSSIVNGSTLNDTTRPASFASLTIPFQSTSSSSNQMRPDQTLPGGYYNQSYAQSMAGPGTLAPALRSPDHALQQPNQYYTNGQHGFGFQSPPPQGFFGIHSPPSMFPGGEQQSQMASYVESPSSLSASQNDFSSLYGASDPKSPDQLYMSYPPNEQSQFSNEPSLSGSDSMETETFSNMLNLTQDGSSSISPTSPQPLDDPLGSPMADSLEFSAKQEPQSPIQSKSASSYKGSSINGGILPSSSKEKEQNKQKLYRNRKTEFTKKMQDELLAMGMLPSTRITHAPEIMSKTADTLRDYRELLELIRSNVDGMPSNLASVPAAVRKLLIENANIPGVSPLHRPPPQQHHPQLIQQPTHGFKPDIKMAIHPHPHHTMIHPHQQQQQFRSF